jgi:hypothetical protein
MMRFARIPVNARGRRTEEAVNTRRATLFISILAATLAAAERRDPRGRTGRGHRLSGCPGFPCDYASSTGSLPGSACGNKVTLDASSSATFTVRLHHGSSRLRVVMPTSQTEPGYITGMSNVLTVTR